MTGTRGCLFPEGLGNRMGPSAEAGFREVFLEAGVCFDEALLKIS